MPTLAAIERAPDATAEVRDLIGELDQALSGPYLPSQRHALALDELFADNVRFFVARVEGGTAAGCGGVAFYEGFAEVKRMFTRPAYRQQGVAGALLARLEAEARGSGYVTLRLETGCHQTAAMTFYERAGFQPCEAFGPYAAMPPEAIETSVFYEKRLA
jgi:putative acetyltransferase